MRAVVFVDCFGSLPSRIFLSNTGTIAMPLFKNTFNRNTFNRSTAARFAARVTLGAFAASLVCGTAAGQAGAASQQWLVFGLESATVRNTTVPGTIVSGGDLAISGVQAGGAVAPGDLALFAAGDLSLQQGSVASGGIAAGGTVDVHSSFNVGPTGVTNDASLAYAEAAEAVRGLSRFAAGLEPTGSKFITSFGGIELGDRRPGLNVFSITAEELRNSNGIALPVFEPTTDTIVINITGSDVRRGSNGAVFLGELNGVRLSSILNSGDTSYHEKILWNFPEAVQLRTQGSFEGSVFAPRAVLTHTNGQLNGQVIAREVNLLNAVRLLPRGFNGSLGAAMDSPTLVASYD